MAAKHVDMEERRKKEDRGWIADLLLSLPELIILPAKWMFRGISALIRNWL
ncbi:MAG TPA: hypothetical protein VK097_12515 [Lentibacillus sp.]|uniref:hypothetical protein n=1 Tax=Lentibacillus sp. TaxID=1925746 RepID=UPI002B4B71D0|nr:hypothetical protein [Lentibacillus sp.]HLR63247.1 hypothetical protein [Lentibacillus sp.]